MVPPFLTDESIMLLIELKNITKDYHLGRTIVPALRGVDLTLARGEFAAIWGPRAAEKVRCSISLA